MARYTPMIEQYLSIKEQAADALLFFRLGDFYEMFFEDAVTAAKELEITLTGRDGGVGERIPMCGVPYHSAESYIHRLIDKGYKVAICEQVEDPSQAKGIVRREIVRIVTPGTIMDGKAVQDKGNNYIASLVQTGEEIGLALCDVSTGEFYVVERDLQTIWDELQQFQPTEMVVPSGDEHKTIVQTVIERVGCLVTAEESNSHAETKATERLLQHFNLLSLESVGLAEVKTAVMAAGMLLSYLEKTQKRNLHHLKKPLLLTRETHLIIDSFSRRNLELTETIREKSRQGSLLWLLDKTVTAMGGRLLKKWVERPLAIRADIERRLNAVEELVNELLLREDLRNLLGEVYDLERLVGRVAYGSANGRDLLAIASSLSVLPEIRRRLLHCDSPLLQDVGGMIVELNEIVDLINSAIVDEPPVGIRDGGLIRDGYDAHLDKLKQASREGKQWIARLEQQERERTGIKSLKVGFNKVFGYYLEVTKSNVHLVPSYFERKQTLANGERYITPELKEKEALILEAEDKMIDLEQQLFLEVRDQVAAQLARIQQSAEAVAHVDALQSLATVAVERRYTKPVINDSDRILIEEGRHPVVEAVLKRESFVSNNTLLDCGSNQIALITGPNMAGKSTYMRQVALIVVMAQMGSFVPAKKAEIGIVDRVFTRIGASDDLTGGQSTFMVEMVELANILHHATRNSLIILDEIGRGTSTFDGISIAKSVIEYLHQSPSVGAKTLFATHYHELTELAGRLPGVTNYSTHVQEQGDSIVFLRKIIPQPADRSYGIQVAKLAGLPDKVLHRAKEILHVLESMPNAGLETAVASSAAASDDGETSQLSLNFDAKPHPVVAELQSINLLNMTPIEALTTLHRLQQMIGKG
ncbi:DNA mismatch repair protein MutS [Effusibacillus lacus]|uniref:DNA mismatch repair protein MutS n=1 Tax=Effusibacillus lacus TaxID=1348429 RepID=A0A292YRH2_9BACL|nr:DNA mismatch repair protein MutS [Effusibacillus lacus]TCS75821.1 DNA mismatch repair protein MutS [Effusibacillus lacus]GAX91786.1 DNA mismatch repair protein MutS [Effusibacillus lacus]